MESAHTYAILLGASNFPHFDCYLPSRAFLNSKQDFRKYLQDSEIGLALSDDAILDLFDSHHNATDQLLLVGKFLDRVHNETDSDSPRNLLLYYVGHGYFSGQRQEYHVALASLRTGYETTTGLKVTDLAEVIKDKGRAFRRFVFLDCCFAAEATPTFMGASDDAMAQKLRAAFTVDVLSRPVDVPRRGTALFCAADKDHVALSPSTLPRTMFSDALLDVLDAGDANIPTDLTLVDIYDLIWERLQRHSEPVRPVLHSPDQTQGDIAKNVILFPNAARARMKGTEKVFGTSKPEPTTVGQALEQRVSGEHKEIGHWETMRRRDVLEGQQNSPRATNSDEHQVPVPDTAIQIENRDSKKVSNFIAGVVAATVVLGGSYLLAIGFEVRLGPRNQEAAKPATHVSSAKIFFDFNKATMRPDGMDVLDKLASTVKDLQLEAIRIVGHADVSDGPPEIALHLSEKRAEAVKAYFVSKGIPPSLIATEGKGLSQSAQGYSISTTASKKEIAAAGQVNRRVSIEVRGRPLKK